MRLRLSTCLSVVLFLVSATLFSQITPIPPLNYYDDVDLSATAATHATLHAIITANHTRIPYTSTSTDTWDVLEVAMEYPDGASTILDVYRNAIYDKAGGGNTQYQREHSWPNSYGFPVDGATNYPYTDLHALYLADSTYNASRGNTLYRYCSATCDERPTDENNGTGGSVGVYPGFGKCGPGVAVILPGRSFTWLFAMTATRAA